MTTTVTSQLRSVIKQEYIRCAKDPTHFLRKYCIIQHPLRGKILFSLYDFQEDVIRAFEEYQYNIVLKARQIGLSTCVAGYALWRMLFHTDQNILVIATKKDTAKNLVTKVRVMHQNLPVWLRGNCTEDNKLSLVFANGSQIKAISSSPDAGRSEALSLLILDEAAFIEGAGTIWTAAQATLSTGGNAIILSTPDGKGNFFHKKWQEATTGEEDFNTIFLSWRVHPERDQTWRDEQTRKLGEMEARQEHDADFISSGKTVIAGDLIEQYREDYQKEPKRKEAFDRNLWIWEEPDYNNEYMVVADVARGDGEDKSAFHVIELKTLTQVAEYKGLMDTKRFGALLVEISTRYDDALLVVENSGVGWAVLQEIINRGYKNLFYTEQDLRFIDPSNVKQKSNKRRLIEKNRVPGFTTSLRTRPLIISRLDECMRDGSVLIQSSRTFDELEVFIWKASGKAEAMEGYNDDLTIAMAIGLWVRDTALRLQNENLDRTRMALEHFGHSSEYIPETYNQPIHPGGDPFKVYIGGTGRSQQGAVEDIRWLLD